MKIKLIALISILAFTLSACSDDGESISLEKAGKQADEKIANASEAMGKKMHELGDAMEKKGEEIGDAIDKEKAELEKK